MDRASHDSPLAALPPLVWIVLLVGASLGLSRTFACAMPFAALAAFAATRLGTRDAFVAVLMAWAGNQAIGFLLLFYPHGWATFAWGGAIGFAALAAAGMATAAASVPRQAMMRDALAFVAAFGAYEAVLFAATCVLPSGGHAFAPWIVARIFAIDATAFLALLALHRLAVGFGLVAARRVQPAVA